MLKCREARGFSIHGSIIPPTAIRVRLLSFSIPRTRRRLRSLLHRPTSKKRWRRLVFWTPQQSISLNRSIDPLTMRSGEGFADWRYPRLHLRFDSLADISERIVLQKSVACVEYATIESKRPAS